MTSYCPITEHVEASAGLMICQPHDMSGSNIITHHAINPHFPIHISLISLISYSIQLGWVKGQVQLQPAQMEQHLRQMMETSQPTLNKYNDTEK